MEKVVLKIFMVVTLVAGQAHSACPLSPVFVQQLACPTGQHGAITQTRSAICDASTQFAWRLGSWSTTSSTCGTAAPVDTSCQTSPITMQQIACPTGKTGAITQTRTATCNQNQWQLGSWSTTAEDCTYKSADTTITGTIGVGYPGQPTVPVTRPGDSVGEALAVACWQSGTTTCSAVAGVAGYGVPAGFTTGNVNYVVYTGQCSGTAAGQVKSSDGATACSCPSIPTASTAACTSYGFDNGSVSTVIEGSICKSNYGAVLSANTGACTNNCPATAVTPTWGSACAVNNTLPLTVAGGTSSVTNSTTGYTGTIGYTCNSNRSWSLGAGTCTPTGSCPAAPATSQTVACPSGQAGTHTQTRTATCNASTSWGWTLGAWTTSSNTCAAAPKCPALRSSTVHATLWGLTSMKSTA